MAKHWLQQMSAAVNREASRNITSKASKKVDKANITQRDASAAIDLGDDVSHQSTPAMDNYEGLEVRSFLNRRPLESSSPA